MYLLLGSLWALGAAGLFVYEWQTGDRRSRFLGSSISSAWIMVLLAAYNFVRWYSAYALRAERAAQQLAYEARLRQARRREPPPEPDPTFDFTDRPK